MQKKKRLLQRFALLQQNDDFFNEIKLKHEK